jgi:hypothetical protein
MDSSRQLRVLRWNRARRLLITGFCASTLWGQQAPSAEYAVKAAFLLNFTRFVEWPPAAFAGPEAPMEVCILGKDPFGRILDDVAEGESVRGHRLVVRRIAQLPTGKTCQTLFIATDVPNVRQTLSELSSGTLTIGEGKGFLKEGGMIALEVENGRVRFDISQAAAETADLKVSSSLLQIARAVRK